MTYTAAIDFGTSFTAAAARTPDGGRIVTLGSRGAAVPSVVFVRDDGSMVFGDNALRLGQGDRGSMAQDLKRRIGEGHQLTVGRRSFAVEELVTAFLCWVLERITEQEGSAPSRVVFSHPASWNASRISGFERVIAAAGVVDAHLVSEPLAVALHHAGDFPLAVGELVGVFDLGGGILDTAVLRRTNDTLEPAGSAAGEEYLGGSDFDRLLASQIVAQIRSEGIEFDNGRIESLLEECRAAKEALSTDDRVAVTVIVDGEHRNVQISRAQFEQLIAPSVAEAIGTFQRAVRHAGVQTKDLAAVLLVGGSSVIPLVQRMIADALPESVELLAGDRKHAVARGSAVVDLPPIEQAPVSALSAAHPPASNDALLMTRPHDGPVGPLVPRAASPIEVHVQATNGTAALPAPMPNIADQDGRPPAAQRPSADAPSGWPPSDKKPNAQTALTQTTFAQPPAPQIPGTKAGSRELLGTEAPNDSVGNDSPLLVPSPNRSGSPTPTRRRWLVPVISSVLALLALAVFVAVTRFGDSATGTGPATANGPGQGSSLATTGSTTSQDTTVVAGINTDPGDTDPGTSEPLPSGVGMVEVATGVYTVGLSAPGPEAAVARQVDVKAFWIDETEVSNTDYSSFVLSIGAPEPLSWPGGRMPDDLTDHPVRGVAWAWADTFCLALGKRLPAEVEWEAAGQGPNGEVYPWGAEPIEELDLPGSRPIGAVEANISKFGVRDTVGSAWEWVGEPVDPADAAQHVRKGGEYSRVRDGVAMRQIVGDAETLVVGETGFRCAADAVDPDRQPKQFDLEHPTPAAPTEARPATRAADDGAFVFETFEEIATGFPTEDNEISRRGVHAPWYHVEASQPGVQVLALGGYEIADSSVETKVFVDKTGTAGGSFRYGVVVRAEGEVRSPRIGLGMQRPTNFYAFAIDPRAGTWHLAHDDSKPMRDVASGTLPSSATGLDPAQPDTLAVRMRGSELVLIFNDVEVGTHNTGIYHLSGDIGFYVETFDETLAHVHFDDFRVTAAK